MITQDMIPQLVGRQAYDKDGKKIGQVNQVYVDDQDGSPLWATVNTGLFGTSESFVPLTNAALKDRDLTLAVSKDQVKDAPQMDNADEHLAADQQDRLNRYYAVLTGARGQQDTDRRDMAGREGTGRHDMDRDGSITRSEEHLRVGTESVETGHVRLRKYVVTEDQQITVPVSHEEVRIEREAIAAGEGVRGGKIGEETREVTLHAERPVVDKTVEAVEKVRLGTRTVTDQETVSGQVRKEQIEVDDPQHALSDDRDRRNQR